MKQVINNFTDNLWLRDEAIPDQAFLQFRASPAVDLFPFHGQDSDAAVIDAQCCMHR
jgi:hypothetical protein